MSDYNQEIRSLFLRLLKEIILIGVMVIAFSPMCYAFLWKSIEITPSITSDTEYNDNIYYDPVDEEADIIYRVEPGLAILVPVPSTRWDLELAYSAAFEIYQENSDLNDVAHNASGKVRIQPLENIIFTCEDSFYRGKDFGDIDFLGLRRRREFLFMNTVTPSLEYTFGPNRVLSLNYVNTIIDYDLPTITDSREDTINPVLTYGMGRNIVNLDYKYTYGEYETDLGSLDGHAVTLGYEYLLNPLTSILINGRYWARNFTGPTEDYYLYAFLVGLRRDLTAALAIEAQGGYLRYEPEEQEVDNSFIGILTVTYTLERINFNFIADMGYDEIFVGVENLGYASAWGVSGSFAYTLHKFWSVELTGTYRHRDYVYEPRVDHYWSAGGALIFEPLVWFSATVRYEHAGLNTTGVTDDYDVNRVMLTLRLSY
jgi:hypothetical protein